MAGSYVRTAEHRAAVGRRARRHGMSCTPTWYSWSGMIARCTNPKHKDYPRYGGRGITVCERWLSFEGFYADMGERPEGMTLDRRDSDGPYAPGNCRWATAREQRINQNRTTPMAGCHPDREHVANGLCNACYKRERKAALAAV